MEEMARGGGASISEQDLLLAFKMGSGRRFLEELLIRRISSERAGREGIVVEPEELEGEIDTFFAEMGLLEEPAVRSWLSRMKLTREAVAAHVRESVLVRKLRERLLPDEAVDRSFRLTVHDYARASVERIDFPSAGAAAETLLALREGEVAWLAAAARAGGMESLEIRRSDVPEEIRALMFSASPGAFLGPVETDDGAHALYRLLSRRDAVLDDGLREEIRERLFIEEIVRLLAVLPLTFTR